MNTPDGGARPGTGSLPAEHRLAAGVVPNSLEIPSAGVPTPGVALAGARVPTAPTLPDFDPATLSLVMSRLANDLFAAPPVPMDDVSTVSLPSSTPTPGAAPSSGGIPSEAPVAAAPTLTPDVGSSAPASPVWTPLSAPSTTPTGVPAVPSQTAMASVPTVPLLPSSSAPDAVVPANPFVAPLDFGSLGDVDPAGALSIWLFDGAPTAVAHEAPYFLPTSAAEPAAPPPTPPAARAPASPYEITPTTDVSLRPTAGTPFDANAIKREFPILHQTVNGRPLVWLDNAATTQKPRSVIDRLTAFYERENSNVHRAAHTLAARATDAYESARESVRRFLNAPTKGEIVFVRGATEGINLVAQSWGRRNVAAGDEIVITWLEHHANIVPWQQLCAEKGARLRVAPVDDRGQVILEEYEKLLGPRTRIVSLTQVSNALGTVTPAREMIEMAHRHGARVLLDGAQAVSHKRVDVQALDCDFFVFSGHKVFAPTGIGAVFGKSDVLEQMPPWQGGGNMIADVTFERTVYQPPPMRFEAGTGNIADAVGLGAALDWLSRVGIENVERYEHDLLDYATLRLRTVPGLTIIGTAPEKAGVISFVLAGQKTEEIGGRLDQEGIAVRSGHHCAQPILRRFGLEATVRASLAPYNTCEDIDALVDALRRIQAGQGAVR